MEAEGRAAAAALQQRVDRAIAYAASHPLPKPVNVAFMEWFDPIFMGCADWFFDFILICAQFILSPQGVCLVWLTGVCDAAQPWV